MDAKCIRVLRPYEKTNNDNSVIYIDEEAKISLSANWGDEVEILGRRKAKAKIQPIKDLDRDGFIGRAGQDLIDELYIEYGEEVLLNRIK